LDRARQLEALRRLLESPAWGTVRHFLRVRLRVAQEQCLLLNPASNPVELARRQGQAELIKLLLDEERLPGLLLDNLERDS
jgi:hypothetical protein